MNDSAKQQFVESWGSMGMLWGINRSMARIQALLLATEEPISLDDICADLKISRGNASMSLKELRSWRVIHRVHVPGDRRDFYVAEQNVWTMFFRIAEERKRREFDPAKAAVGAALEATSEADSRVQERLEKMFELLTIIDKLLVHALSDEQRSHSMVQLLVQMLGLQEPGA